MRPIGTAMNISFALRFHIKNFNGSTLFQLAYISVFLSLFSQTEIISKQQTLKHENFLIAFLTILEKRRQARQKYIEKKIICYGRRQLYPET